MRIIGGTQRGKRLSSPGNFSIRPTADRVRESIFNILTGWVSDSRVLDLFAGTGAMGLEALSRGAKSAVFIDNHPAALSLIKKNINVCGWTEYAEIIRWDPTRNLNCIKYQGELFSLVFIDPPYRSGLMPSVLDSLDRSNALESKALVTVEHVSTEILDDKISVFALEDRRLYGKTLVSFFRYMV
ncbi:MAG: 16S rRNA (guanine(966)-N(2))-methyltransferase RsmD [Thermodesulfobacteriota bacterium]|nr:16S rRNA (guanine(966)-N(2))-methyltransferase RsmD [Thermodesulfobacteriota bacterium]